MIAIIAIIAAIIFPMMANAKETASKSKATSTMKQMGTSFYLYTSDYDGRMPPVGGYYQDTGSYSDKAISLSKGRYYSTWALLLYPYVKNYSVYYLNYSGVKQVEEPKDSIAKATRFGDIGFAYCHLNRVDPLNRGSIIGIEEGKIANPANTVMLASRTPAAYLTDNALLKSDYGFMTLMQVEPPVNPGGHCAAGWGRQSIWLNKEMHTKLADEDSGIATGLYSTLFKHHGFVCKVDTSCRSLTAAQAASGANCGSLFSGAKGDPTCRIANKELYQWDIE
ncbi:MAG: hypothetical protein KF784_00385 [Fimbriimonadaceae bacterium]|nr:hypothetical protein [Fimbriimonadaceae bacterium]